MRRRLYLAVCLLGCIPSAGCFPLLTHGARIDPGFAMGANGAFESFTLTAEDSLHAAQPLVGMDVGFFVAGTAQPAQWKGAAVRFTASANLSSAIAFDSYWQLPQLFLGDHTGVGVVYQPVLRNLVFPYLMNGWTTRSGTEVYATVGLADTRGMKEGETRRHKLGVFSIGYQSGPSPSWSQPPASIYLMVFVGYQGDDRGCTGWPCVRVGGTPHLLLGTSYAFPPPRPRRPRGMPPGLPPD